MVLLNFSFASWQLPPPTLAPKSVALAAALLCTQALYAQTSEAALPQIQAPITVTANPLGSPDAPLPTERLEGLGLKLRGQGSLGEALDGLLGVSASGFAPGASRPVIRGLDGERIRVLRNGAASLDASGVSPDHAVPMNMLAVEAIEVVRGPAALLYGGSAAGGAVNVLDSRIHSVSPFLGTDTLQTSGVAQWQAASGDQSRAAAMLLDAGNRHYALRADAATRSAGDTRVPTALECTAPGSTAVAGRLCNSASKSDEGALGLSLFGDTWQAGISHSNTRANYGAVAEDAVTIAMQQRRTAVQAQAKLAGWVQQVKLNAARSNYEHTEFEGAAVGTRFTNQGHEWRAEAVQRSTPLALANWQGVWGLQSDTSNFAADGDEAFAPYTQTRGAGAFALQQLSGSWGTASLGFNRQSVSVRSFGHPSLARFEQGERRFTPVNTALSWQLPLSLPPASRAAAPGQAGLDRNAFERFTLTVNWATMQRAPSAVELFANGPHVATAAYELGDSSLGLERGKHLELRLHFKAQNFHAQLNLFRTDYSQHIAFAPTGLYRDAEGELVMPGPDALPEWHALAVAARFEGVEAQGGVVLPTLWRQAKAAEITWRASQLSAINHISGEPLPRTPPMRIGLGLRQAFGASWGPMTVRLDADRYQAQTRVPTGGLPSAGYTLVSLSVDGKVSRGNIQTEWWAKLDNAANQLGYSASNVLTQTVPGKVPVAGRSLRLGMQVGF